MLYNTEAYKMSFETVTEVEHYTSRLFRFRAYFADLGFEEGTNKHQGTILVEKAFVS